jgi:hypothetical protein
MKKILSLFVILLLASSPSVFAFAKKPEPAPSSVAAGPKFACPMFCVLTEKPGKCPKCGMEMSEVEFT